MAAGKQEVIEWLSDLQRIYAGNRELLTALDSAIGDADHGINMDRGFTAVKAELDTNPPADLRSLFQTVAMVLIRTVGGAAGPLYGTFFLRASAASAGKEVLGAGDAVAVFSTGVAGIQQRGKAEAGDKTMLDTFLPAVSAMQEALDAGGDLRAVLEAGTAAAESGMLSTVPMQARKGRASYLGVRSVGHQDPGATSAFLLIRAAADRWA